MKYKYIIILALLFVTAICNSQNNHFREWKGQWIGPISTAVPNQMQQFSHEFNLSEDPEIAIVSLAVDSKYWLWINDSLVVFEGQLKRGPTPTDTYYDEVDVAKFLKNGRNKILILVWYWGKDGFCHNNSGQMGLVFELSINETRIISNSEWKTATLYEFQNSLPPFPNFRLPEHNIRYDARLNDNNYNRPISNPNRWENAKVYGKVGMSPWNNLWKRPVPLWYFTNQISYQNIKEIEKGKKYVGVLPKNITITPSFKINAKAGTLIDIRTDNYMGGSEPNIRTEYICRNGIQEFETPAYMNGHNVIYTFSEAVEVIELKYRESKYDTEVIGSFHSTDKFLNRLWEKSINTLNVNMRDGIQDPDRERAQWWGDVVIMIEEIFYACDHKGQQAIIKAISNLIEWQKKDSTLFSPIPAGNWDKELPTQMLASIGKYGVWKYIFLSGNTDIIEYVYPAIKKYMAKWTLLESGFVKHRAGGWDWQDWGEKADADLLDNLWYYMALEACIEMASHIKNNADLVMYSNIHNRVKKAILSKWWRGDRFASENYAYHADDRANGLAVCAGLVSKDQWEKIKPLLDTTFNAGPYLEKYILEAYFIMDDAEHGIARMKKRYMTMVDHPDITTLWEGWEIGSRTHGGGTINHGWSGGPLTLLNAYIAGIRPTSMAYNDYLIKPTILNHIDTLNCVVPTDKGNISIEIVKNQTKFAMKVTTIKANGTIAVPKVFANMPILINGKKRSLFVRKSKEDKDYMYFSINSAGVYEFELNKID